MQRTLAHMKKSVVFLAVLGLVACSQQPKSGEVNFSVAVDTLEMDALRFYTVNYEVWSNPSDTGGLSLNIQSALSAGAAADTNRATDYLPAGDTLRGSFYHLSVPVTAGAAELDFTVTKIKHP